MNIQPCTMNCNFCQNDKSNLLLFSNWASLNIIYRGKCGRILLVPHFQYPTFHNSNANTGFARYFGTNNFGIVCVLFFNPVV